MNQQWINGDQCTCMAISALDQILAGMREGIDALMATATAIFLPAVTETACFVQAITATAGFKLSNELIARWRAIRVATFLQAHILPGIFHRQTMATAVRR